MANLTLNLRSQCLLQSSDRVYQLDDLLLLPAACRQLHLVQQQQRLAQIPQGHLCQAPSLAWKMAMDRYVLPPLPLALALVRPRMQPKVHTLELSQPQQQE